MHQTVREFGRRQSYLVGWTHSAALTHKETQWKTRDTVAVKNRLRLARPATDPGVFELANDVTYCTVPGHLRAGTVQKKQSLGEGSKHQKIPFIRTGVCVLGSTTKVPCRASEGRSAFPRFPRKQRRSQKLRATPSAKGHGEQKRIPSRWQLPEAQSSREVLTPGSQHLVGSCFTQGACAAGCEVQVRDKSGSQKGRELGRQKVPGNVAASGWGWGGVG